MCVFAFCSRGKHLPWHLFLALCKKPFKGVLLLSPFLGSCNCMASFSFMWAIRPYTLLNFCIHFQSRRFQKSIFLLYVTAALIKFYWNGWSGIKRIPRPSIHMPINIYLNWIYIQSRSPLSSCLNSSQSIVYFTYKCNLCNPNHHHFIPQKEFFSEVFALSHQTFIVR